VPRFDQSRFSIAFEAPGYHLLWFYSLFSAVAFAVDLLSQGWLVLQLTNSPFWVGVAAAVRGGSQAVFSIVGGSVLDRLDRRKTLLTVQIVAGLGALTLALLILTHVVRLWHVFAYLVLVGLVTAISRPSAWGLMYDMVGPQRILNASAFQFMAASVVRIIGAVVGGFIIDRLGVGENYLLIAAAYCGCTGALWLLRNLAAGTKTIGSFVGALTAGFHYALHMLRIRHLLLLSLLVEAFGFAYIAMMPVMARDILKVGGAGFGYLTAMAGVGQLGATLLVASRGDVQNKARLLVAAASGFGVFIALFALSPWFSVSLMLVTLVGAMGTTYDTVISTMLMTAASDAMRGRVLGLYFSTMGLSSLGWLVIGAMATVLSLPMALVISGSIVALGALGLAPKLHLSSQPRAPAPAAVHEDET
jgi:MFS family permease